MKILFSYHILLFWIYFRYFINIYAIILIFYTWVFIQKCIAKTRILRQKHKKNCFFFLYCMNIRTVALINFNSSL